MNKKAWLSPTPEMMETEEFDAIWQAIKTWDVNVPEVYEGYCGANGNHVRVILDALNLMTFTQKNLKIENEQLKESNSKLADEVVKRGGTING